MPEYTPCGLLIKQILDRLKKQANNALREKDLTMMQIVVLVTLQEEEDHKLSMKELERYLDVAQSTVAGIVSRLEQKGLVESAGDRTDKRIKLVHITAAGEQCCSEAACEMDKAEENLLHGFSEEERKQFHHLLMKAAENLK